MSADETTELVVEQTAAKIAAVPAVATEEAPKKAVRKPRARKKKVDDAEVAPETGEAVDSKPIKEDKPAPKRRVRKKKEPVTAATEKPQAEDSPETTTKAKTTKPPLTTTAQTDSEVNKAPNTSNNEGKQARSPRPQKPKRNDHKNRRRKDQEDEEPVSQEFEGITLHLREVSALSQTELLAKADELGIENAAGRRKQAQVSAILKQHSLRGGTVISEGVLEILPDGYGFLRSADANYLTGTDDIYVS
ncbi:MAG: Rho termination factor N-terminal domain-containing protein, partial [Ghiorsea sp.]